MDRQDSVYREWFENGKMSVEGMYKVNSPVGLWDYYYLSGMKKSTERVDGGTNYIESFWLPDSLHTQTIIKGTGELATYYTTGAVKEWYNYVDGLKHGKFEELSIYGYPMLTGSYKKGKKDSIST